MNRAHPDLVVALLREAWLIFGPFTPENHDTVTQWVIQSVNHLPEVAQVQPQPKPKRKTGDWWQV